MLQIKDIKLLFYDLNTIKPGLYRKVFSLPDRCSPITGLYLLILLITEMNMEKKKKEDPVKKERKKPGLKKGQTNNPNGRPKGSTNLVTRAIKENLIEKLDEKKFVDEVVNNLFKLKDPNDFLNQAKHLYPYLFPRAISDEEQDNANKLYGGLAHLFGKHKEE